jgi:hypothetical protein
MSDEANGAHLPLRKRPATESPESLSTDQPIFSDRRGHTSLLLRRLAQHFDKRAKSEPLRTRGVCEAACRGLLGGDGGWAEDGGAICSPMAIVKPVTPSASNPPITESDVIRVLRDITLNDVTLNLLHALFMKHRSDHTLRWCLFLSIQLDDGEKEGADGNAVDAPAMDDLLVLDGESAAAKRKTALLLPRCEPIGPGFPPAFARCFAVAVRNLIIDECEFRGSLSTHPPDDGEDLLVLAGDDEHDGTVFGLGTMALRFQWGESERLTRAVEQLQKLFRRAGSWWPTLVAWAILNSFAKTVTCEDGVDEDEDQRWRSQVLREVTGAVMTVVGQVHAAAASSQPQQEASAAQGVLFLPTLDVLVRYANGEGIQPGVEGDNNTHDAENDDDVGGGNSRRQLIGSCLGRFVASVDALRNVTGHIDFSLKKLGGKDGGGSALLFGSRNLSRSISGMQLKILLTLFRSETFLPDFPSALLAKQLYVAAAAITQTDLLSDDDMTRRRIAMQAVSPGEQRNELPSETEHQMRTALLSEHCRERVLRNVALMRRSMEDLFSVVSGDQEAIKEGAALRSIVALCGEKIVADCLRMLIRTALTATALLLSRAPTPVAPLARGNPDVEQFQEREQQLLSSTERLHNEALACVQLLDPHATASVGDDTSLTLLCRDAATLRWSVPCASAFAERYRMRIGETFLQSQPTEQEGGPRRFSPVCRRLLPAVAMMVVPRLMEQRLQLLEADADKEKEDSNVDDRFAGGLRESMVCAPEDIRICRVLLGALANCVLHGNPLLVDVFLLHLSHLLLGVLRPPSTDESSRAELHAAVGEVLGHLVVGAVDVAHALRSSAMRADVEPTLLPNILAIPPLVVLTLAGSRSADATRERRLTSPLWLGPATPPLLCAEGVASFLAVLRSEEISFDSGGQDEEGLPWRAALEELEAMIT